MLGVSGVSGVLLLIMRVGCLYCCVITDNLIYRTVVSGAFRVIGVIGAWFGHLLGNVIFYLSRLVLFQKLYPKAIKWHERRILH